MKIFKKSKWWGWGRGLQLMQLRFHYISVSVKWQLSKTQNFKTESLTQDFYTLSSSCSTVIKATKNTFKYPSFQKMYCLYEMFAKMFLSLIKSQWAEGQAEKWVFKINVPAGSKHPAQPGWLIWLQHHCHIPLGDKITHSEARHGQGLAVSTETSQDIRMFQ